MAIATGYQSNFETLKRAFADNRVCLAECSDAKTGKTVVTICAVGFDGTEYQMVPLAKMFDGNPYKELLPPQLEEAA
jgi:hypothetical protein